MNDVRIKKLAGILVRYSIGAKSGEKISVSSTTLAEPLVAAIHDELLGCGAWPFVQLTPQDALRSFLTHGKDHHFDESHPIQKAVAQAVDGSIRIEASNNTRALSDVDPKRQARMAISSKPVREVLLKKKWVLTLFPTEAHAQDAGMSLSAFEDFVYAATFADRKDPVACWKKIAAQQAKLIAKLKGAKTVRIVGPETDLTMSIKGRTFINSCGHHNMPCGELFTGPVEDSAEGHIRYDFPVFHAGREISGIRLVFRKGLVVEASAEKNEKFLLSQLDMDPGARRLGELGIGTNFGIDRFIGNILFDEKIGGTIHLALGASYPETGGRNVSALHWDMIKDLRKGGALYIDGKMVQSNGKFC